MLYVKLGSGGSWFKECERVLRLGFWTGEEAIFDACRSQRWNDVRGLLRTRRGKADTGSVEDDIRQISAVFDDDGSTTWITFHDRKMYWAKLDPTRQPERRESAQGCWSEHHLVAPWTCKTSGVPSEDLLLDDLAGHLGQVTQYRGTICAPEKPSYVLCRIMGAVSKDATDAQEVIAELERHIAVMMQQLTPYDFEILVDMTFAASGWRRVGKLGGTEADVDLVLVRSAIGAGERGPTVDRVGVQVKSRTNQREFEKYAPKLLAAYPRAFFVYHTGDIDNASVPTVHLIDAKTLAPMVLDAGLARWLLRRVR